MNCFAWPYFFASLGAVDRQFVDIAFTKMKYIAYGVCVYLLAGLTPDRHVHVRLYVGSLFVSPAAVVHRLSAPRMCGELEAVRSSPDSGVFSNALN